ncbi:MAG: hypothetical protein KGV51_06095 [Moraxellaceae bacterium]|nr:hypothetical protein [Moraxellaceae bacterium]
MSVLSSLQQTSNEIIYIALSAIVAIIIWLEGQTLKATKGKMPESTLFHLGSLIDTMWFFVSLACLYYLSFQSIAICVPIAYVIYSFFGWIYGTSLISKEGIPDKPEDLVIPLPFVAYNQSFALIYFILCVGVLKFPTSNLNINLPFNINALF